MCKFDVEERIKIITVINISLVIIVTILIVGAMAGSLYFFVQTRRMEQTVVQVYELNGEWYRCEHTTGSMNCNLLGDPDMGGGKLP